MAAFLDDLRSFGPAKVPVDDCLRIFRASVPNHDRQGDMGAALFTETLRELADGGHIRYGRQSKAWVRIGRFQAPPHIMVVKEKKSPAERNVVEWDARLAPLTYRKSEEQLADLKCIDDFLKRQRTNPSPVVPLRARSLSIFGDEKKLERYKTRDWTGFHDGALSMADLACFIPVEIYFACTTFDSARSDKVLLVENSETYYVTKAWNSRARKYRAVALGNGNTLHASVPALGILMREIDTSVIEYFGDIDEPGLRIPISAIDTYRGRVAEASENPLRLLPAIDLYEMCLECGSPMPVTASPEAAICKWKASTSARAKEWLKDDNLHSRFDRIISEGKRVAQEWLSMIASS